MANKSKGFQLQRSEKLSKAKARLKDYNQKGEKTSQLMTQLRSAEVNTREELSLIESKYELGEATQEELSKASAAYEQAKKELTEAQSRKNHGDNERQYLLNAIERFQEEEQAENLSVYKPLYEEAISEFDSALEAAKEAAEKLLDLQVQGGELSIGWPGAWPEFLGQESKLLDWRKKAQHYGLL